MLQSLFVCRWLLTGGTVIPVSLIAVVPTVLEKIVFYGYVAAASVSLGLPTQVDHSCLVTARAFMPASLIASNPVHHSRDIEVFRPTSGLPLTTTTTTNKSQLMGVAYLRDTGATTLRIILASSEAGKGWSYRTRVMRGHAGEYPGYFSVLGLGLWVLRGKGDL